MRARLLARLRSRDEHGFTMTEVVLVVVMLGLIAVPLTSSLFQAITIMPTAKERTADSLDRVKIADKYNGDVVKASTIYSPAPNATVGWLCIPYTAEILRLDVYDGDPTPTQIRYRVQGYDPAPGLPNWNFPDPVRIEVQREVVGGATEVVLEGYCDGSITTTVWATRALSGYHTRLRLTAELKPVINGAPETLTWESALRTTQP
jgi:prepilin-type N-terminal cleavage/methylation domain-containing protein